jgi:hypothetical protein
LVYSSCERVIGFGDELDVSWYFLWLWVRKVAEGVGNAPTSVTPILFSRQVQPAYICLPSIKELAAQAGIALGVYS